MNIIVCGGAGGIGKEIALLLCEKHKVAILDIDKLALSKISSEYENILCLEVDITNYEEVKKVILKVNSCFHEKIDAIINFAAVIERGNFLDLTLDAWNRSLEVNIVGVYLIIREVLRGMLKRRSGKIIFFSSTAAKVLEKNSNQLPYSLTKAGVSLMSKQIVLDYAEYGIQSNIIVLGNTSYGMVRKGRNEVEYEQFIRNVVNGTPRGKMTNMKEIYKCVEYLLSENSECICGQEIILDGGFSIGRYFKN